MRVHIVSDLLLSEKRDRSHNLTTELRTGPSLWVPWGFPGGSEVKASACVCLQRGRPGFDPWVGKIPWRRKLHPTPVFLPGESHGRRSLVGYSPRDHKESDTTERLHFHFHSACKLHKQGDNMQP